MYAALWSRLEHARGAVGAFLHEALSDEERAELVQRIFARRDGYGPSGLMRWESRWYERDLPAPPARVLVGGCGDGRELVALAARGYTLHGFEPSLPLADSARRALGNPGRVWTLSYEDLLDGADAGLVAAQAPYDAVICGWGSFAHLLGAATRERVLAALARWCPRGPLLLSFPFLDDDQLEHAKRWRAPAQRWGGVVRRWRGLPSVAIEPEEFLPHAGFVHRFEERELSELALALGRELSWGELNDVYPHCTLRVRQGLKRP